MKPPFEILEHPSDLGIEAHGNSMQEVFRNAAHGFMSVVTGTSKIEPRQSRSIELQALDRENLMVRWLTEILYLYDAEKFLTADVKFETLTDTLLKANILGEPYDCSKHELKLDVKAITYHQLKVEDHDDDWVAHVFVDI
ncbi:MAG: archease [Bacteroidota bacterium]